jgi:hypothetical protein
VALPCYGRSSHRAPPPPGGVLIASPLHRLRTTSPQYQRETCVVIAGCPRAPDIFPARGKECPWSCVCLSCSRLPCRAGCPHQQIPPQDSLLLSSKPSIEFLLVSTQLLESVFSRRGRPPNSGFLGQPSVARRACHCERPTLFPGRADPPTEEEAGAGAQLRPRQHRQRRQVRWEVLRLQLDARPRLGAKPAAAEAFEAARAGQQRPVRLGHPGVMK